MTINGDIELHGTLTIDQTLTISGQFDFADASLTILDDLIITSTATPVSDAFADATIIVDGDFSISGTSSTRQDITSVSPWFLTVGGSGNASWVRVSNSNASGGQPIYATNSLDGGQNENWFFQPFGFYNANSISVQDRSTATLRCESIATAQLNTI